MNDDQPPIDPVPGTFLSRLADDERQALLEIGVRRSFRRGASLMLQEDGDQRVMLLLNGRVKVSRGEQDGRELMLSIRDAGDIIGELAFVDGIPRSASVTAIDRTEAVVLTPSAFRAYLERTPRVAVRLLETVALRFRDATERYTQHAARDTMGRLAGRLVELVERYGTPNEAGWVVAVPITRDELAAWTGASRAGVAQAMQSLRQLGWVRTDRRRIEVLDLDALRTRASF